MPPVANFVFDFRAHVLEQHLQRFSSGFVVIVLCRVHQQLLHPLHHPFHDSHVFTLRVRGIIRKVLQNFWNFRISCKEEHLDKGSSSPSKRGPEKRRPHA
jgi:hypothetical protein